MKPHKKLRVGIIGAGEVTQVIHLPTLSLLNHLFTVLSICDISAPTVDHVAAKFSIPHYTTHPLETITHPDVDVVFILTADEVHESLCISALKAGKLVFIEKPLTLSVASAKRIVEEEERTNGRVFVGYMRRYAPSFQAFKKEVENIPKILYARSRDIVGPNAHFVGQSGTSPVRFPVELSKEVMADSAAKLECLMGEAFPKRTVMEREKQYWRFLCSLGSHDLSLLREALGSPEEVIAVTANHPFYTALFAYKNADGTPYSVTYESGIDNVPRFDASLTVYGENKTVSIKYDTPYIKGLPIIVTVDELNGHGEASRREVLSSFEDAYTVELKKMHGCFTEGREFKTSARDAMRDLELFERMFRGLEKQG